MQLSQAGGKVIVPRRAGGKMTTPTWASFVMPTVDALSDAGLVGLAFALAYHMRYGWEVGGAVPAKNFEPLSTFSLPALLLAGLVMAVFAIRGIYVLPRWIGLLDLTSSIVGGLTTSMAGVILLAYFFRFNPSRLTFLYAFVISLVALLAKRFVVDRLRHRLWRRGIGVQRVLVLGAGTSGRRIIEGFLSSPMLGYQMVGYLDDGDAAAELTVGTEHGVVRAARLGRLADLEPITAEMGISEVVIALAATDAGSVERLVERCRLANLPFRVVPDLFQLAVDRVELGEVAGVPLIGLRDARITGWNDVMKRLMDITVSVTVLVVGAVPMLLLAWAIRRDSPGPVLCHQRRVGKDARSTRVTKFRTMVAGAEEQWAELVEATAGADPRRFKVPDDPRRTRAGRWMRRWSLDELPQFWDILRGRMSLVGPRPALPPEVAHYEEWHKQRFLVRPGLTGLWQVNGRSNLTFDEMVRLDLYYAEHWSPWLDAKILLRTIPAVLSGRGAY
ncbi:MAG: sugar transferase [Thermomicrobiales bacterium]